MAPSCRLPISAGIVLLEAYLKSPQGEARLRASNVTELGTRPSELSSEGFVVVEYRSLKFRTSLRF